MNETRLKEIRKHFKNSDTSRIAVKEFISAYLKVDAEEPLYVKQSYFEMLDEDDKGHLMTNFKKVLSGGLNKKVFELRFREDAEESTQDTLDTMLLTESLQDFAIESNPVIQRMIDNFDYDTDVVVNLIRFELGTDEQTFTFVLGTVNKIEQPKGKYVFQFDGSRNGDFTTEYPTNPIINLTSPIDGFMYPVPEDDAVNVNKIINFHKKANETHPRFVTEVLTAELVLTAKEEKNYFTSILKQLLGDKVKPQVLHQMYSAINQAFLTEEDTDQRVLHRGEVQRLLEGLGVELQADIQHVYEDVLGLQNYGFKVDNIIPDFSKKSFEISSDEADIKINPKDLNKVRQVKSEDGQMFLMVELNRDSTSADGLSLDSDEIPTIAFQD